MEKKFTNHLIDIGFIDKKTESQQLHSVTIINK